jgi:hypothetical protein
MNLDVPVALDGHGYDKWQIEQMRVVESQTKEGVHPASTWS